MSKVKKLIPLFNRILVKKFDPILHSKGGILIPENASKKRGAMKGKVIAVGIGDINKNGERVPMSIKIGDVVLLPDYGGIPVQDDSNNNKNKQDVYFILRETEILAKFVTPKTDGAKFVTPKTDG